jgi:hypothetical protein
MESSKRDKKEFVCLECNMIHCLNLLEKSKDSSDAGQELYVYGLLGEKIRDNGALSAAVCANGKFLNASCFLLGRLQDERSYLLDILTQAVRDFKASIFLAFSGHYRQAMQVLRCSFENIISGIYFQSDYVNLIK